MQYVLVRNADDQQVLVNRVRWCDSFFSRLRGLTFRRRMDNQELILVEQAESRIATMIHMMFVFFPISAIWIDSTGKVVDARLAKPFRLCYLPQSPAQYILEGHPSLLEKIKPGDRIEFVPTA